MLSWGVWVTFLAAEELNICPILTCSKTCYERIKTILPHISRALSDISLLYALCKGEHALFRGNWNLNREIDIHIGARGVCD